MKFSNLLKSETSKQFTKKEANNEIRGILKKIGHGNDHSWIDDLISALIAKGVDAIDDFKSQLGSKDSPKLKNVIMKNSRLISYLKNSDVS